jgi:uncharacterized protein YbjT (DUF2867 family)
MGPAALRFSIRPHAASVAVDSKLAMLPETSARRAAFAQLLLAIAMSYPTTAAARCSPPLAGMSMNILLTGYTGFIGSRLLVALVRADHRVLCAGRRPPPDLPGTIAFVRKDFMQAVDVEAWLPHLEGVDIAINAAGSLRSTRAEDLERVHVDGPIALFQACAVAGVRRIIQVSALGADAGAATQFHSTKRAADEHLRQHGLDYVIAQPSLVYGRGGASAALFAALASAPLVPLPGDGSQSIQPVHVEDVVAGILAALTDSDVRGATIPFVGPEPMTLRRFLQELRAALGLRAARFVRVPWPLVRLAARLGTLTGRGLLSDDTLAMLLRGNTADPAPLRRLLQREPRSVRAFVEPATRSLEARDALLGWLIPVLRFAIAAMWLVSGIVSLGPYPVDSSLRMLAATGITTEWMAVAALYGAALLDIALGVAIFVVRRRRRLLWAAQILVVLAYTAIISIRLPEFWLEPFGPVLKNLPVLAALWLLYATEERRWNT